jgi:hypothetical protein
MNIYLDIDGVLITKNGKPAKHLKPFLKYVLENHTVYWLTTHCKGDASYPLNYLKNFLDQTTWSLLRNLKATNFNIKKTEAIDFENDFLWLDDCIFSGEIEDLQKHNKMKSWIKVDLSANPNQLLDIVENFPL